MLYIHTHSCDYYNCCTGDLDLKVSAYDSTEGMIFSVSAIVMYCGLLLTMFVEETRGIPRLPDSYIMGKLVFLLAAGIMWLAATSAWSLRLASFSESPIHKFGCTSAFFSMPCIVW